MEELLQSCGPGSKKAKWGACALLFTDKDRTAHLTRSLASQYEGNIAFGEVRGANKDLSARFNVTRCLSAPPAPPPPAPQHRQPAGYGRFTGLEDVREAWGQPSCSGTLTCCPNDPILILVLQAPSPRLPTPARLSPLKPGLHAQSSLCHVWLPAMCSEAASCLLEQNPKLLRSDTGVSCSYPTLLAFCNGDPAHPIPFTDAIEAAALNKFLQQFKGGKKCASAVHINENTDFEGMRVGQLKEVLKGMGAECAECAEKKDYVQRLRALVTGKTEL